ALLKQYVLPSLSFQLMLQVVGTCWPSARPSAHWPPNWACSGVTGASAAYTAPTASASSAAIRSTGLRFGCDAAAVLVLALIRGASRVRWRAQRHELRSYSFGAAAVPHQP